MTPPGRDWNIPAAGAWSSDGRHGRGGPIGERLPPDRHGPEIPVKESCEIRYFLRLVETYFGWRPAHAGLLRWRNSGTAPSKVTWTREALAEFQKLIEGFGVGHMLRPCRYRGPYQGAWESSD